MNFPYFFSNALEKWIHLIIASVDEMFPQIGQVDDVSFLRHYLY